jgi:hypothetical protein
MNGSIPSRRANKLYHMRERVLLHSLITGCRHRGLRSSLCVRRFETPLCINYCRMIWWSTYGGFEATPTSFHLIYLKTCQFICLFYLTVWDLPNWCLFEPNVGKLYEIRRTGTSICKNKSKTPISGRIAGAPAGSSALPTRDFRPIQRELPPDSTVGGANSWRCSECLSSRRWSFLGVEMGLNCYLSKGRRPRISVFF